MYITADGLGMDGCIAEEKIIQKGQGKGTFIPVSDIQVFCGNTMIKYVAKREDS